jgi:hypothetical protein
MTSRVKQALVLGGLVAGAFGLATLLNGRRKKKRARPVELDELPDELEGLQQELRAAERAP